MGTKFCLVAMLMLFLNYHRIKCGKGFIFGGMVGGLWQHNRTGEVGYLRKLCPYTELHGPSHTIHCNLSLAGENPAGGSP